MTYDEIIEQLEITKSKIKEIARNEYGGESWNDDLDALTEAADIVADYSRATAQASEMSQKYEQPAMAVRRAAGLYTCPLAEKLNRTALATRGKYERLQNPEYNKRYNRGQNEDYEYQGIRSISGKDILKDRELMDGAEFQELEPVQHERERLCGK